MAKPQKIQFFPLGKDGISPNYKTFIIMLFMQNYGSCEIFMHFGPLYRAKFDFSEFSKIVKFSKNAKNHVLAWFSFIFGSGFEFCMKNCTGS